MSALISNDIEKVARLLQNGEVVAIPTETVYGLAANAFNEKAVARIFEVKNRPFFDPLIVHVSSIESIYDLTNGPVSEPLMKLLQKFSPGPLTVLLPKSERVPDIVTAGLPEVAVRIPNHLLTLKLLQSLDFPLCAPSANPFGYVSPTTAAHVFDQLGEKIPMILDGGICHVGLESTIVGMEEDQVVVYRLGGLSLEAIEVLVGKVQVKVNQSSNPKAPGMLTVHYAPSIPVYIGMIAELYKQHQGKRLGLISFQNNYNELEFIERKVLSPSGNLAEAAAGLFAALRSFSPEKTDVILAEVFPDEGLGRAINDRLLRASKK